MSNAENLLKYNFFDTRQSRSGQIPIAGHRPCSTDT